MTYLSPRAEIDDAVFLAATAGCKGCVSLVEISFVAVNTFDLSRKSTARCGGGGGGLGTPATNAVCAHCPGPPLCCRVLCLASVPGRHDWKDRSKTCCDVKLRDAVFVVGAMQLMLLN